MALFDVISHDNFKDCKQILEQNPSSANSIGWHGITPLHRVASKGNLDVLGLLLQHEADVNKPNAFGETPIHYACQTASLKFVNILVENGADITLQDNGGRTCVHHAARSGSIWKVHYFVALGLDLKKQDSRGQTVLHIAAEHGHIDLVDYCLKHKRFEAGAVDNNKLTPLHVAARHRNRKCAWILESSSPQSLVYSADMHGKTPLDYAAEGTTLEHRWLTTHLNYWQASRCGDYRPLPWLPWLLLLLSPSLLIYFVAWCLREFSESTGRCLAGIAVVTFYSWAFTAHRLRHVSGLPSPTFAGMFFGVIFQSLLCYFTYIAPKLWPAEMFWVTVCVLVLLVLFITIRMLYRDPGLVKSPRLKKHDGEPYTIIDVAKGSIPTEEFCIHCEFVVPPWTKHCTLCDHCVLGIDHHCLFLMWCVAYKNHRAFLVFMVTILLSQILFIRAAVTYLSSLVHTNGSIPSSFREAMGEEVYISTLFIINCAGLFWVFLLTMYQFKLVSEGATTYYNTDGTTKTKLQFKQMCKCGKLSVMVRAHNLLRFFVKEYSFYTNNQLLDVDV